MKASILFIFLALSTTGNSQRNQRVNGETVPNDTLKWKADLVSTLKLLDFDWAPDPFTFYIGVDNPYTIIGKGFDQESMKATISSGSITKVEKTNSSYV
jgi:hypothetical protein